VKGRKYGEWIEFEFERNRVQWTTGYSVHSLEVDSRHRLEMGVGPIADLDHGKSGCRHPRYRVPRRCDNQMIFPTWCNWSTSTLAASGSWDSGKLKMADKRKAKYSRTDSCGRVFVDCSECQRGGNGSDPEKCAVGFDKKKGNRGGCFTGSLLESLEIERH
jgi:hypothetical protein